jgi:predicted nucleic acid-binding protein
MRVLVDTSVLVPALIATHSAHSVAAPWLDRATDGTYELIVSGHNLAETYAVLTRMKVRPPLKPKTVLGLIEENICAVAGVVTLSADDYRSVLQNVASAGLAGGVIYDALIAQAAIVAGADHILTLNGRDFSRLWPGAANRVISPLTTSPPAPDAN